MKKIIKNKLFWLILLIGIALRLYQLGEIPGILNRDEAALAYNAYLLMETGQDEWQKTWPLTLKSFGDYKLSGYPLLIIPFFKAFGLHDWVVRLPSMLAGVILLPLSYLLAKRFNLKDKMSLLVMFLMAISPVMIFYSRTAYEANVGLAYFVSILLLIFSIKDKPNIFKNLGLFLLLLGGIFTYNTPFLLLPFLIILLLMIYPLKQPKKWLVPLLSMLVVLGIGAVTLLSLAAQKSGITIFTDETVWANWTEFRTSLPSFWIKTLGSKYFFFLILMLKNFFLSFSPKFLVTNGGAHEWHSIPTMGHILGSVYVLSLIGLATTVAKTIKKIFKQKIWKTIKDKNFLLLYLLVISLAPSIVTVDSPHATRSLLFFVLLHVLAGIGLKYLISLFKKPNFKKLVFKFALIIISLEGLLHAYRYFILYPTNQTMFLPGFEETIQQVYSEHKNEEVIAIIDPAGYQYILTAWYLKLTPEQYFSTINRQDPDKIGFRYGDRLFNFHFIAHLFDRIEEENTVVYWDYPSNQWFIKDMTGLPLYE